MSLFDEEPARKKTVHEIGQDISLLSGEELQQRIALLKAEIVRLEAGYAAKTASRSVAENLFKK